MGKYPRPGDDEIRALIEKCDRAVKKYSKAGMYAVSGCNESIRDTLRWVLGEMRMGESGFEE